MANQHSQNKIKDMNLNGKRFYRWLVIGDAGFVPHGEHIWECICDCGSIRNITAEQLIHGGSKSCGCYQKDRTRELFSSSIEDLTLSRVMHDYQGSAKKKRHSFNLTKNNLKSLIFDDCYYCGAKPSNTYETSTGRDLLPYNGIDRKDNSKGYTPENVVPCCVVCNKMKKTLSHDEFLLHIHRISSRFEVEPTQPDFCFETCGGVVL